MYLPIDKARLAIQLLAEGNSIRSTSRIAGIDQNTVMSLWPKWAKAAPSYYEAVCVV